MESNRFIRRYGVIRRVEEFATLSSGLRLDGHACMLRAMCEMSAVPLHADGIVGEALAAVLTPVHVVDQLAGVEGDDLGVDYVAAQRDGRLYGDCTAYHAGCDVSIFEVPCHRSPLDA